MNMKSKRLPFHVCGLGSSSNPQNADSGILSSSIPLNKADTSPLTLDEHHDFPSDK